MLDYIKEGSPVVLEDCESIECVTDRIILELQIRVWGYNVT